MRMVTHSLEGYEFEKTCNNDKNLSKIQLEHEKEDELVAVAVKVVYECRHWMVDCMMVVKEIENGLLENVEKLEWWFQQDINDEGEKDEEDEGGGENCPKCENLVDGHYCQGCALLRKKFKEDLFTYCIEDGILQDSFKPSNGNTNVVNALQEPFVIKQDPVKIPHKVLHKSTTIVVTGVLPVCYDDDDEDYTIAITLKEPDNSLSMGDEHLDTIPATESDEFINSSVENLVPNPSKSEGEYECDVPACEDFTFFSILLFDVDYDFSSSDDQSFFDEDIPKKIYLNPFFNEEIISMKIDLHHFNAESNLIESLLNHDSSIISSSSKIDSLFNEFAGELTLLKSIPSRINETDCNPKEEIRLIKILLYDNSSPQIDLSFTSDDPMPPGIDEDDYNSERDILILEELLSNDSLSLPENESFYFDIPSSSRPPAKPLDGNSGILNVKVMGDIYEHKVPMPRHMLTQPTLVLNQEKSPGLLSHQGHEAFQPSTECLMRIYRRNIPILDVSFLHFYPLLQAQVWGNWVKLSNPKQALCGRHPMLILSF
uniref:Uncharacterized protein n=1 Tax=Tanacetum cinerariifolium TaxID=118510 RepID=A0A6L2L9R7_TANCI|nr:hypothetical protein [Tanacetum cinerariifolium]